MDLGDIVERVFDDVGRARVEAASGLAWERAEGLGRLPLPPTADDDVEDVPHRLADVLFSGPATCCPAPNRSCGSAWCSRCTAGCPPTRC